MAEKVEAKDINMGTVYDWNKAAMLNFSQMKSIVFKDKLKELKEYIKETDNHYYMLLCHDLRDYTIFSSVYDNPYMDRIKETLENRGFVLSIEKHEGGGYEIWIRNEEGAFAYYFFPYDEAIVEF